MEASISAPDHKGRQSLRLNIAQQRCQNDAVRCRHSRGRARCSCCSISLSDACWPAFPQQLAHAGLQSLHHLERLSVEIEVTGSFLKAVTKVDLSALVHDDVHFVHCFAIAVRRFSRSC